jgi:hypothetical protein
MRGAALPSRPSVQPSRANFDARRLAADQAGVEVMVRRDRNAAHDHKDCPRHTKARNSSSDLGAELGVADLSKKPG